MPQQPRTRQFAEMAQNGVSDRIDTIDCRRELSFIPFRVTTLSPSDCTPRKLNRRWVQPTKPRALCVFQLISPIIAKLTKRQPAAFIARNTSFYVKLVRRLVVCGGWTDVAVRQGILLVSCRRVRIENRNLRDIGGVAD